MALHRNVLLLVVSLVAVTSTGCGATELEDQLAQTHEQFRGEPREEARGPAERRQRPRARQNQRRRRMRAMLRRLLQRLGEERRESGPPRHGPPAV
jgi:hypothetical protein